MLFGNLCFHLKCIEQLFKFINILLPFKWLLISTVMVGHDIQLLRWWFPVFFFHHQKCSCLVPPFPVPLSDYLLASRVAKQQVIHTLRVTGVYCQVAQPKGITSLYYFEKRVRASVSPHPHFHKVSLKKKKLLMPLKIVRLEVSVLNPAQHFSGRKGSGRGCI